MPTKKRREFTTTVLKEQSGFDKEIQRFAIGVSVFDHDTYKEYVAYATADGIDVGRLDILNYTIEFLDPITLENTNQEYDSELFEEVFNESFDYLYELLEKDISGAV